MARENSLSDSDGRSLTPDIEEENDFDMGPAHGSSAAAPASEANTDQQAQTSLKSLPSNTQSSAASTMVPGAETRENQQQRQKPSFTEVYSAPPAIPPRKTTMASPSITRDIPGRPSMPLERFRSSVRKVIHLTRGSSAMSLGGAGAEPGIDPRRSNAFLNYGHIHQHCTIQVTDYSWVRSIPRQMHNKEFVEFMADAQSSPRAPWIKVRWINIGGISWDVMSAVALAYSMSFILP